MAKRGGQRRRGRKRKVALDTVEPLITAVAVLAGNAPDNQDALELVAQTEHATDCPVEETYADGAYGDGETRQAFADAGRTLHAKVPALSNGGASPRPPSPSTSTQERVPAPPGRRRRACEVPRVARGTQCLRSGDLRGPGARR